MPESKKTNENTDYELFTREVYQQLFQAESVENIDIKHNIKIKGKSEQEHQIDIYWEFKQVGEIHKIAIECKNYNKPVSIAKVRDFNSVINDIGNIKGIMVTKQGFQKGAQKFADFNGISLKELRTPIPEDWNGRLKTVSFNIITLPTKLNEVLINLDLKWLIDNNLVKSEEDAKKFVVSFDIFSETFHVYDNNNQKIKNLLQLEQELPNNFIEGKGFEHTYYFDNGFIDNSNGKIKIESIYFNYDILSISSNVIVDAQDFTIAILKDIKSGEIKFIKKDK